jgi:AAHS family 4-hydroxybenzoate transporter-like MFS transporter
MGHIFAAEASFADPGEEAVKRASVGALLVPEFRHDTLLLWAAFFFGLLTVYTSFSWMPAMLTGAGLDVATASRGLAAFNLGGVVGAIGAALLIVRIGSKPAMLGISAVAIAGALVLAAMPINASASAAAIILMIGITGGAINAVQTTMYALAAHVYPTDVRVTGVGTASAVGRIGGLLSSFIGAWVISHGGSVSFFLLTAGATGATLAALALLRRHVAARSN